MERSKAEAQIRKARLGKFIDMETEANKALQKRKQELENRKILFKFEIAAVVKILSQGTTGAEGLQKQLSTLAEIQRQNKELSSDIQRLQEDAELEISQRDITDVKEKKRKDKENAGTRMSRVQEAKGAKQYDLVDLQTRNQISRPKRGARRLEGTQGVKEEKRIDKKKVETRLLRVQEAKGAKRHLVDLQRRNQIPRPYRGARLLEDRKMSKRKGIPLCLPDNIKWCESTGEIHKTKATRSSLCPVPAAVEMLMAIKEPVCVVSIAGTCRDGKSYILGKVFGQKDIFSIGHEMDPETMGIWMWVVPQKFKDSHGRDCRVILLDSEGIGSVTAEDPNDNQIFTLTVLLASVLIYNSKGVPKRNDLNNLSFIVKLSQRIRIRSKGLRDDQDLFRNTFPFFIWLLRDVAQKIPEDCRDLNQYFTTRVFKESQSVTGDEENHQMVSESIINFFSGFEAFSLPAPSEDDEIMQDIENCWGKLNPKFRSGVESFETLLKSKLSPKQSVNRGEYVTGEALGRLVQLYTDAINDPDAIPNVEAAWDTFVRTKCNEAKEGALKIYDSVMSVEMKGALPCDGKVILKSHKKANNQSLDAFEADTAELVSSNIDNELKELTISIDKKLNIWKEKNASETKMFCQGLLEALKMAYIDPVLAQIRSQGCASVTYSNIMAAWDAIKNDFHEKAVGSKDVIAIIFKEFNKDLRDEVKKYKDILKTMKDYDDNLAKEKVALAVQEEEQRKLEECMANLKRREEALQRKIAIVENKREKEVEAMRQQAKTERERVEKNMNMMREAGMKRQLQFQSKLDAAADRERQANEDLKDLRRAFKKEKENTKAQKLAVDRQNQRLEREAREMQAQLQNQLSAYGERERRNNDTMQNLSRQLENDRRELSSMRNELESVQSKLREANKPGFFRRILKAIW